MGDMYAEFIFSGRIMYYKYGYVRKQTHPVPPHDRWVDNAKYRNQDVRDERVHHHQSRPTYPVHPAPPSNAVLYHEPVLYNSKPRHDCPEGAATEMYAPGKLTHEAGDRDITIIPKSSQSIPIFVKIHFTAKPVKEDLAQFLRKYRICKFKRIQATNTFAAQLKSLDDFDRICASDDVRCGPNRVNVKPSHKLAARAKTLRTAGDKHGDSSKYKNDEKQVEANKVETKKQINLATEERYSKNIPHKKEIKATVTNPVPSNQSNVTPNKTNEQKQKDIAPKASVTKTTPIVNANKSVVTKVNPAQETLTQNATSKPEVKRSGNENAKKVQNLNTTPSKVNNITKTASQENKVTSKNQLVKSETNSTDVNTGKTVSPSQIVKTKNVRSNPQRKPNENKAQVAPEVVSAPKNAAPSQVSASKTEKVEPKNVVNKPQGKPDANKNQVAVKAAATPKNVVGVSCHANVKKTGNIEAKNVPIKPETKSEANKNQIVTKVASVTQKSTASSTSVQKTNKVITTVNATNSLNKSQEANKIQSSTKTVIAPKTATPTANVKNEVKINTQPKPIANKNNVPANVVATKNKTSNQANAKKTIAKNIPTNPQPKKPIQKKPITPKTKPTPNKGKKISPKKPNKNAIKSTLDKYEDFEELTDQDILALISGGVILDECSGSDDE